MVRTALGQRAKWAIVTVGEDREVRSEVNNMYTCSSQIGQMDSQSHQITFVVGMEPVSTKVVEIIEF